MFLIIEICKPQQEVDKFLVRIYWMVMGSGEDFTTTQPTTISA